MGNLRNSNPDKLWDWEPLNDCFTNVIKGTKIKVMDVDGVVERKANILYIETKRPSEQMSIGQKITLESFTKKGDSVIVIYGNDWSSIEAFEVWHGGKKRVFEGASDELIQRVESWFRYADANPSPLYAR